MTDEPRNSSPQIILSTYLTQKEWKAVYAYYWVAMNLPAYGAAGLGDEERWELLGRVGTGMLWAIRQLALRHGARFEALSVDPEGAVSRTQRMPICEANILYVARMKEGKGPNYLHLLTDAMAYIREQGWSVDLEPMEEALAKVKADVEQAKADMDPATEAAYVSTLEEGMKIAGYTKGRLRDRFHGGGRYDN